MFVLGVLAILQSSIKINLLRMSSYLMTKASRDNSDTIVLSGLLVCLYSQVYLTNFFITM